MKEDDDTAKRRISYTQEALSQELKEILEEKDAVPDQVVLKRRKLADYVNIGLMILRQLSWCSKASAMLEKMEKFFEEHGDELPEDERKKLENAALDLLVSVQQDCPVDFWP